MEISKKDALVIVDMQYDFLPEGTFPQANGEIIIPMLNKYIELFTSHQTAIFFIIDWHPVNHCSFQSNGGRLPVHCVEGTHGASIHAFLKVPADAIIIRKGTNHDKDIHCLFEESSFDSNLKANRITTLFIGGIATEFDVKDTAIEACHQGYNVFLLSDAIKEADITPGSSALAMKQMKEVGTKAIQIKDLIIDPNLGELLVP